MISVITPSIRPQYLDITQSCLERQTFQDFEWLTEIGLRNKGNTLARDLNKMLRRAKGERVVMLQDCIHIDDDALERINNLPNAFYTFPVGKVHQLGDNPSWDWREHKSWEVDSAHWEADFASAPLQAFYDIGGYDESYDEGWSWDNVDVGHRAKAAGYRIFCQNDIRGIAIDHDSKEEHPWRHTRELNDKRAEETWHKAQRGDYKLNYL
jgi:hypothetical protein